MREHYIWSEKHRPTTVEACILPQKLKTTFQNFVKQGDVPNLLLIGPPGIGKTSVAMAMLDELGCNYMLVAGSLKGDMDTLRNEITQFASSVSFTGKRKYVIIDEADFLSWKTQPALRNFMQEYAANCGFILTANYANKMMPEMKSRGSVIEFQVDKEERPALAAKFHERVQDILAAENVKYDRKVLTEIIIKYFPDFRRVLNELQRYAAQGSGTIDQGILTSLRSISIIELIKYMKAKNFTAVRKWVAENLDNDAQGIFREFYNEAAEYFDPSYIPELVLTLAKYQHQAMFSVDPEINLAAFLVEVMVSAIWKG